MRHDRPILVDDREESIHFIRNIFEMRRNMVSYVDGLFAIAAAELSNIRDRGGIERPECVLVEGFYAFLQSNLDAVR